MIHHFHDSNLYQPSLTILNPLNTSEKKQRLSLHLVPRPLEACRTPHGEFLRQIITSVFGIEETMLSG